ncbi:alpha-amylase family glycosyl hydrolase [Alteribacter aurantiacus]|uniref:alpha-amylase family glycosyl hydrolase n=1 Tax=Alteribacter aurantiacus TaxID=254410 RepID=UPI0004060739|nr:alpha-amylase family glycosyl hydrolase [Alteribacter aurantiacus]
MKKYTLLSLSVLTLLFACDQNEEVATENGDYFTPTQLQEEDQINHPSTFPETVFYEIFPRAFYDTTGDGIGDIQGMIEKLDYLEEMGIEGLWLMPIHPTPTYHGYDVIDYYDINPDYGTMDDFREFVSEAHDRDIKILVDYVVNHTSIEHPWFVDAISSEDSEYRDWYIWADENTRLSERGEWGQPYWHGEEPNQYMSVFWSGMPDLNMDNPDVREKLIEIGTFWLEDVGVDGFRLDAAKHIYPGEHEKNLEWWAEFRTAMESVKEDVFLVGEVWDIPSVTAPYLEEGLHSVFNFDLGESMVQAARSENGNRLVSGLIRDLERFDQYADDYVLSTFLTNHDMNRVMSELRGHEERARMAASLLFTLPGSPFVYYGEEIGMEGQKPDEHIREPMLWYKDREQMGMTSWIDPRHDNEETSSSVEEQWEDPDSLLRHYQTMIHLRRSTPALLHGKIEDVQTDERSVVAFYREDEHRVLVAHNLGSEEVIVPLPENDAYSWHFRQSDEQLLTQGELTLPAYSTAVLSVD